MERPLYFLLLTLALLFATTTKAQTILAFYDPTGEPDHTAFAQQAITHFTAVAEAHHLTFRATTNWDDLAISKPALVLWLNGQPHTAAQRTAFEHYMDHGGAWLGFHVSAYNDGDTHWPWFVQFLGGGLFDANNWPPLPARLHVDTPAHPITANIPTDFDSPANEWYSWTPNPRTNPAVTVLLSIAPSSLPLGLKDRLLSGDVPVMWTNTRYRMVYANMGHGAHIFDSPTQNRLFENTVEWLLNSPKASPASPPPSHPPYPSPDSASTPAPPAPR